MMKNNKTKLAPNKQKSTRVIKPSVTEKSMDGVFALFKDSLVFIFRNWKIFASILAIYALLDIFFVSGLSIGNSSKAVTGNNILSRGISVFNNVTSTASTINSNSGIYQTIFAIIISLAVIYAIRQLYAKKEVTISDAFYKGMYPIIPSVLVILIIVIQFIPLMIGSFVLAYFLQGIANISIFIKLLAAIPCLGLFYWSFYMLCSSVIAFYVSTLPDMKPMQAIKSAKEVVEGKRLKVFWRIIALPIALSILIFAVIFPIGLIIPAIAGWVYFIVGLLSLMLVHSYLYRLYRELI
jgi:hypothetical protein